MRTRWRVLACGLAAIAVGAFAYWPTHAAASRKVSSERVSSPSSLELYYTPPVLVRAGERVTVPVDVICATRGWLPCSVDLTLGIREPSRGWTTLEAGSVRRVRFDLSAPAARAALTDGSVSFFLRARAGNRVVSLPPDGAASPLQFHVTEHMPIVNLPALRYGDVRKGSTVLFLPWGSGPRRAGLSFGHEVPTWGPSAFDFDDRGRIYLLDPAQRRLAVFDRRRLTRTARLDLHPSAAVAVRAGGVAVLDQGDGSVRSRTVDPSGRVTTKVDLGRGIPSDIRPRGDEIFAHVLPLDAWVRVTPSGPSQISTGRPFRSGAQLLRIGNERSVRLGTLSGGRVRAAVEIRSKERFGEVALAEPDGRGGYVAVVRVWRQRPSPADQFQVVHLGASGRVLDSFAVSSAAVADVAPLGRFRLGPDGDLYELVTGPDGARIVRFDVEGGER